MKQMYKSKSVPKEANNREEHLYKNKHLNMCVFVQKEGQNLTCCHGYNRLGFGAIAESFQTRTSNFKVECTSHDI